MVKISPQLRNVILVSFCFFFLFAAFRPTQMLAARLLGDLGTTSVAMLYIVFVLSLPFAPYVTERIGERRAMCIGGLMYVPFIACFAYVVPVFVIAASFILGMGAALLWTGQGTYLGRNSDDRTGSANAGLFIGIFNLSGLIGNFGSAWMLARGAKGHEDEPVQEGAPHGWDSGRSPLFVIFTILGIIGSVLCLFLPATPDPQLPEELDIPTPVIGEVEAGDTEKPFEMLSSPVTASPPHPAAKVSPGLRGVLNDVKATLTLLVTPRMLLLVPMLFLSGFEPVFVAAWVTRQIHPTMNGNVMGVFSVMIFVVGMPIGKFLDKFGRNASLPIMLAAITIGVTLVEFGNRHMVEYCQNGYGGCSAPAKDYLLFFIGGIVFSAIDAPSQTIVPSVLREAYPDQLPQGIACWRIVQNLAMAIGFFVSPWLGTIQGSSPAQFQFECAITILVSIVACVSYYFFERKVQKGQNYREMAELESPRAGQRQIEEEGDDFN